MSLDSSSFLNHSCGACSSLRAIVVAAATVLGASTCWAQANTQPVAADLPYASGRLLVVPRAGLSAAALDKLLQAHGGKARRLGGSNVHVVDLDRKGSEQSTAAALSKNPHFKLVELDRIVPPNLVTTDPYLGSEWHLHQIGAPAAWDVALGAGVTIAILDTGVESNHPDLAASMVPGWNVYDNNSNTADVYGHGTKVAGAAAAAANNATGVAGVAGNARIMPIRISDVSGGATYSAMAAGITWAADHGARIANISYVAAGSSAVRSAADYMKSKGGLVTTSAGNYGTDPGIAQTTSLIPVSATGRSDTLASWSSFGQFVTVAAPGEGIYTTTKGGGYAAVSGTSFSSPITAGVLALMMAARPTLPNTTIEKLLSSSALDLGATGRDIYFGNGRVDAAAAVQATMAAVSTVDSTAPSVSISSPAGLSTVTGLVAVDVSSTDNVGVSRVELSAGGKLLGTDTTGPYAFTWDTTLLANGMHNLVARAYDAAGNVGTSATVSVNVANNVVADSSPPAISIISPANGATITGTVTVKVSASDNNGPTGLAQTLAINGTVVARTTGGALNYSWNTRKYKSGSYTLTATARDAAGNSAIASKAVTIK